MALRLNTRPGSPQAAASIFWWAMWESKSRKGSRAQRRWPRVLNVVGLAGCLLLVVTLPIQAVLAGVAMFGLGLAGWLLTGRRRALHAPA